MATRWIFLAAALVSLPPVAVAEPPAAEPPAAEPPASAPTTVVPVQGAAPRIDRAGASPTYTYDDALRVMRAQHPALMAAEHAVSAARADRRATSLWQNPVLGAQYYKSVRHNTYDSAG